MKQLKNKPTEHYGDAMILTNITGKSSISFRDTAYTVLHEKWVSDKVFDANS